MASQTKHKLSARTVASLKEPGRHGDGGGLYLSISKGDSGFRRRWVYLFKLRGKNREMGLGGHPEVSLAEAREERDRWAIKVKSGIDPIAYRENQKVFIAGIPTFGEMADEYVKGKSVEWRNKKHQAQWMMTLSKYAGPIRNMPVDQINTDDILSILKPLWEEIPETASRLRGRIEHVLDAARAKGYREGMNPALWRGHLDKLLPKRAKLTRGHHAAMPYDQVSGFIVQLREREAVAAFALEFLILTAARSGEVLNARWEEIDLKARIWTVAAERMKAGRIHRVPLSDRALDILKGLAEAKTGDFVFPGRDGKKPLSGMSLEMIMRRMAVKGATPHGFRSSFRDWCGNETDFPREIAEAALAHVVGDETERAYRRSDALERRRGLMEDWAEYCCNNVNTIKVIK